MAGRILVLEDDRAFALDLERALQPFGCEIILVDDGSIGLARAVSESVDLVVVSAELRGTNGFRICNRLKKFRGRIRIPVIITWTDASGSARAEHGRLPTAADSYIKRPFGPSELRGQVRAHVPALAKHATQHNMPAVRIPIAVEPAPKRRRVDMTSSPELARLERDLATAEADQSAMEPLRARLLELESENSRLHHELTAARVTAAAVFRLSIPPPDEEVKQAASERELTATRELIAKKDGEIVALKARIEAAQHAAEANATPRGGKARVDPSKGELDKVRAQLAELRSLLEKTRKERDARIEELSAARAAAAKSEGATKVAGLEAEVAALRHAFAALEATHAATIAERALSDVEREEALAAEEARRNAETAYLQEHAARVVLAARVAELEGAEQARSKAEAQVIAARDRALAELATRDESREQADADWAARLRDEKSARARIEKEHREALAALERTLTSSTEEGTHALWRAQTELAERDAKIAEVERERDGLVEARAHAEQKALADKQALAAAEVAHTQELGDRDRALAEAKARIGAQGSRDAELATLRASLEELKRDLGQARRATQNGVRTLVAQEAVLEKLRAAQRSTVAAQRAAEERARKAGAALAEARAELEAEQSARAAELSARRASETSRDAAHANVVSSFEAEIAKLRAELDRGGDFAREDRVALERVAHLEVIVARTRESLDFERRDRLREEGEFMVQMDELEARIAARDAELAELRDEVPALEAEIAALHSELASARTKLENDAALVRSANEHLEKNKRLIERARKALADLVDASEG